MIVHNNISLKQYNTFGIDVRAKEFVIIDSVSTLKEALKKYADQPIFVISGGSNMLLQRDLHEVVLYIDINGISIAEEDDDTVVVKAMAGENWHQFVLWTLQHDFGGLENLSLIPGKVGTTPIQNIGAYGVEIKDHFVSCEAVCVKTQETKTFVLNDCAFGYRESVFKSNLKGGYIITSVNFRLTKKHHQLRTSYGAIETELNDMGITNPTIQDVSKAVINIRSSKLPDPAVLGNSGSFFKNPIVQKRVADKLLKQHPEMPHYKVTEELYKVPAGWLIEQSGFKGLQVGNVGMHKQQALVLVNYGNATGAELWQHAQNVQNKVFELYGIELEPEVNVIK